MKESKQRRLRSLAAFLVPVAFAILMMQPAPLHQVLPLSQPPSVQFIRGDADSYAPAVPIVFAQLLEGRWCVRSSESVAPQAGDLLLRYGKGTLLLRADRQYLLPSSEDGFTRQVIGKALYQEALALCAQADPDLPQALLRMEQEAQS